ncbi:MAG: amidase [Nitrococcus sp.]|nr:amidase [Nitrococcus sp.]
MTPITDQIAGLTAVEMLGHFERGDLSPVEVTEAALEQIQLHNETVNAYCFLDEQTTRVAARQAQERRRRRCTLGLLDGVPVAIKDVFMVRGWPTRKGSKITDDSPAPGDSPVIASLRRHGFVPLGKTTTPELGWKGVTDSPLCGVTRNPWDPAKGAGGSSGGSAAAVSLGMGALALGTDAGGSIRIPGGFCGIVGFKPTQGRVPFWPASAFGQLAHPGPMTWSVKDAALMMNVLCEPDARDTTLPGTGIDFLAALTGGLKGWHVAFSPSLGYVNVDPEVAAAVAAAAGHFEDLGAHVEEVDPGFPDPREAFDRLFYSGAANALREISPEHRRAMDPALVRVAEWAERLAMLDYLAAINERAALIERMNGFHERYRLLLTPTLPLAAFDGGLEVPPHWQDERWPSWTPFTYPFNMTGQPAISVPCGFTSAGLPIGLQIIGARHRDEWVLRAAHTYQGIAPLMDHRPALFGQRRG